MIKKILVIWGMILMVSFGGMAITPTDGDGVMLQANIILDEPFYLGQTFKKDVTVRLRSPTPGNLAQTIIWEKKFIETHVVNGAISLTLDGRDMHGRLLIADMFDAYNLWLEVEIDQRSVRVKMSSYPYVIRSRISDDSSTATALQGIKIKESDVNDGDFLVVMNGQWMVTSNRAALKVYNKENQLNSLVDVNLSESPADASILGYNGAQWVAVQDQQLTEDDVDRIASEQGFIKSDNINQIESGIYDQITGIGGMISVDSVSGKVNLDGDLSIDGNLLVGEQLGLSGMPITKLHARSLNVLKGDSNVELKESFGALQVSKKVKIESSPGRVITGIGKLNRIAVFNAENDIGYNNELMVSNGQLGIGAISSISDSLVFNVEGNVRVSESFVYNDAEILFGDFVKKTELSKVATSGDYMDLNSRIPVQTYLTLNELNQKMAAYATKEDVNTTLAAHIESFKDTGLDGTFQQKLVAYDTADVRNQKLSQTLDNYPTKAEADASTIDGSELKLAMENYYDESQVKNILKTDYTQEISALGLSGDYADLINAPAWVLTQDVLDFITKTTSYATVDFSSDIVESYGNAMQQSIMQTVYLNYVTHDSLNSEAYEFQSTLDNLHLVSKTGKYSDLNGGSVPDLSGLLTVDDIKKTYIDNGELTIKMGDYLKKSDVHIVGRIEGGRYSDLIGAPNMNDFLTTTELSEQYISQFGMDAALSNIVMYGDGLNLDLSIYAKISTMNSKILDYTPTNELAAVAVTGRYQDLIFDANIDKNINASQLSDQLNTNHVKISSFESDIAALDATYFNEQELEVRLQQFKDTQVASYRNTVLGDYYKKEAFEIELERRLDVFRTTTMATAILNGFSPYLSNEEFIKEMEIYADDPQGYNDLIDAHFSEYWSIQEMNDRNYVRYGENNEIINEGGFIGVGVMPKGSIILWYKGEIPIGWNELRDVDGKFILASGTGPDGRNYSVNQTGGVDYVALNGSQLPSHDHAVSNVTTESSDFSAFTAATHTHTDTIQNTQDTHIHNQPNRFTAEKNNSHSHASENTTSNRLDSHQHEINTGSNEHTHQGNLSEMSTTHQHFLSASDQDDGAYMKNTTEDASYEHGLFADTKNTSLLDVGKYTTNAGGHKHNAVTADFNGQSHAHSVMEEDIFHTHDVLNNESKNKTHTHSMTIGQEEMSHSHEFTSDVNHVNHNHGVSTSQEGQSVAYDNRPPYFNLKYIIKIID